MAAISSGMIFIIGLHKTGLTSISSTLNFWGYPILKFPPSWESIAKYAGASDLPVARQFKELDRTYPNAKFIFTMREINSWLDSAIRHHQRWDNLKNAPPYMKQEFQKVYGSLDIQPEAWRSVYQNHELEVREYFSDREADILYLNIFHAEAQQKLEQFLEIMPQKIKIAHFNQNAKSP